MTMNHNLIDDIRCCLDLAPISTQGEDPQAQLTMIGTKCLIKAKTIAATPLEPFELLGEDFVKAMVAKVNRLSRFPLQEKQALVAFEALKRTPEFFRRYLNRYLTHAELGAPAALGDTCAHVFNDANYRGIWTRLLPADREVLKLLADDVTDMHSAAALRRLGVALGLMKSVSRTTPAHSLRRLQEEELVVKLDYGDYQIMDAGLVEWIRSLELEA